MQRSDDCSLEKEFLKFVAFSKALKEININKYKSYSEYIKNSPSIMELYRYYMKPYIREKLVSSNSKEIPIIQDFYRRVETTLPL